MVNSAEPVEAGAALGPRGGARSRSALPAWLALSVLLHVTLILSLPATVRDEAAGKVHVLEVVLVAPEAPSPPPAEPRQTISPAPPSVRRDPASAPRKQATVTEEAVRAAPARIPEPKAAIPAPGAAPTAPDLQESVRAPQKAAPALGPLAGNAPGANERALAPASPPRFNAGYLQNPPLRYPLVARRRGEEGTVTLRVHVRRDGVPASVGLEKSSGSSALDHAALEAVRAWRFAPARQGEEAVDAWVLVPVVFRLEGAS